MIEIEKNLSNFGTAPETTPKVSPVSIAPNLYRLIDDFGVESVFNTIQSILIHLSNMPFLIASIFTLFPLLIALIFGGNKKVRIRLRLTTGVILINSKPVTGVKIERISTENILLGDVNAIARAISRGYWDTAKAFMIPLQLVGWDIRRKAVRKLMETKVQEEINISAKSADELKEKLARQFQNYIKKIDNVWTPIIRKFLVEAKNKGMLYKNPVVRNNLGPGEEYTIIQPYTGFMESETLPPFNPYGGMFDPSRIESGLYEFEMWLFKDPYCQIGKRIIPNRKKLKQPKSVLSPYGVIPTDAGNEVYWAYKKIIQSPIYQRTINFYLEYFPEDLSWAKKAFEYPFGEEAILKMCYPSYDELPKQARTVMEMTYGEEGARQIYERKMSWVKEHPLGIGVWSRKEKIPYNRIPVYSRYCVSNAVSLAKIRMFRLGYWKKDNYTPYFASDFENAVRNFQTKNGLKVTGEVDKDTWTLLGFVKDRVQIPDITGRQVVKELPDLLAQTNIASMGFIGLLGFLLPFLIKSE